MSENADIDGVSAPAERWYKALVVGQPYFLVGFVDEQLTIPSIGSFVYLGVGVEGAEGSHCFQDAYSWLQRHAEDVLEDGQEPGYVVLPDESLEMIADRDGLVAWLQSPHSISGTPGV